MHSCQKYIQKNKRMPNIKPQNKATPRPKIVARPAAKSSPTIENDSGIQNQEKSAFRCEWKKCSQFFSSSLELDGHISKHLESIRTKAPHSCKWNSCSFSCPCLIELQRHVLYHGYHSTLIHIGREECKKAKIPDCTIATPIKNFIPELKDNFICHWINCNRSFVSIVEFQAHVVAHSSFDYDMLKTHDNNVPKAKCNWTYCKKVFPNKYRLTEHTRAHSNQKLLGCFKCGELFRTKTTLFDHCRRQESNNTHKYQCGQCFKFYATEKLLRNHVVVHVNCIKCSMCDMTCPTNQTLAKHIRYRHMKERPIKCSECKYSCVSRSDLAKHKRHVHTKHIQRCGEAGCSYSVKSYHSLRRHYLEVHANSPSIYLCHCCDKLFKYGNLLSQHLIAKHKFQLPSGHKRFTYRIDENGFYCLETTRIESLEVTKQILSPVRVEGSELNEDSSNGAAAAAEEMNIETIAKAKSKDEALQQLVTITLHDED